MNFIWLIGTFTFAVVLAVVTEDIVATVLVNLCLPLCFVYLFAVSTSLLSHFSDMKHWGCIQSTVSTSSLCHLSDCKPVAAFTAPCKQKLGCVHSPLRRLSDPPNLLLC